MSKTAQEVAGEIVQELLRAKASIIAATGNYDSKKTMIEDHLSDDAVAVTFKRILEAVDNQAY